MHILKYILFLNLKIKKNKKIIYIYITTLSSKKIKNLKKNKHFFKILNPKNI